MGRTIWVCEDAAELARRSAEHIADAAARAVAERGSFALCLSGGDTPVGTYSCLATEFAASVPWRHVHIFWGDERCIPLERSDNHFTMATNLMLSRVAIPAGNVHRARGEAGDPAAAAIEYEMTLRRFFDARDSELPRFDLLLLGMGEDGHVASVFPKSDGWYERKRWVVDHFVTKHGERVRRLTLTMPVLTAAREVMFLVSGGHKAHMLADVLEGIRDVPARAVDAATDSVVWVVDREAAACLSQSRMLAEGESR